MPDMKQEMSVARPNGLMKAGVLIRLAEIALLSLLTAFSYASEEGNLFRMATSHSSLELTALVLVLDAVLTLLWLRRPFWRALHLGLFILTAWLTVTLILLDLLMMYGGLGTLAVMMLYMPVCFIIGLIPFWVYGAGLKQQKRRALAEQAAENGSPLSEEGTGEAEEADGTES